MHGDEAPKVLRPLAAHLGPMLATFVPAASSLSPEALDRLLARVDARLAAEDPGLGWRLRLFVRVMHFFPLVGYGRTFRGLPPARRLEFFGRVEQSRIALFRVGLWGLRTLLFLGWYGDPEVQAGLGYRPDARGWEAWAPGTAGKDAP